MNQVFEAIEEALSGVSTDTQDILGKFKTLLELDDEQDPDQP